MTIANGYLTLAELKSYLSIGDTNDDPELERAIESASRLIDRHCGRIFYSNTSQTFYFDAANSWRVWLKGDPRKADLQSVTSLTVDTTGNGTYDQTWTEDTHYVLGPRDSFDGVYYRIDTLTSGGRSWPSGFERIKVVGDFGWPSVPAAVANACAVQAAKIFQVSKDGGGGYAPFTSGSQFSPGGGSKFMDRTVVLELGPYRHPYNTAGVY